MPAKESPKRLLRLLMRWSLVTLASLAVFGVTFWGWVALGLPPAGADQLIVAPAIAAVFSGATLTALSGWAEYIPPVRPRGYLSRMSSRGTEEVYPIGPGRWRIGRESDCDIVVPDRFQGTGRNHVDLSCDDTGFWLVSLHDNGTYIDDKLIPQNRKQPFEYGQQLSLAGPSDSKPEKCRYLLTQEPQPWPRAAPTDNRDRSETMTVLMLLADPAHSSLLDLDREFQVIRKTVSSTRNSGQVLLKPIAASSLASLSPEVQEFRPSVLHISGIGSHEGKEHGIVLPAGKSAGAQPASADELLGFFRLTAPMVRCVILDACYTREQGLAIAQQVACVIGTRSVLSGETALAFTLALYEGLADGRTVGEAFTRAKNAVIGLVPRGRHAAPVIHAHQGTRRQCLTG